MMLIPLLSNPCYLSQVNTVCYMELLLVRTNAPPSCSLDQFVLTEAIHSRLAKIPWVAYCQICYKAQFPCDTRKHRSLDLYCMPTKRNIHRWSLYPILWRLYSPGKTSLLIVFGTWRNDIKRNPLGNKQPYEPIPDRR